MFYRAIGRVVARAVVSKTVSRVASRGLTSGRFGSRNFKSTSERSRVREKSRSFIRGFGGVRFSETSELSEEIGELKEEAFETVESAYYDAMDTMYAMCANEGQETVFEEYIIEAFARAMKQTKLREQWEDVDIGEYMAFMGEIVEEGNNIMADAYDEANSLIDEIDDIKDEIQSLAEEFED